MTLGIFIRLKPRWVWLASPREFPKHRLCSMPVGKINTKPFPNSDGLVLMTSSVILALGDPVARWGPRLSIGVYQLEVPRDALVLHGGRLAADKPPPLEKRKRIWKKCIEKARKALGLKPKKEKSKPQLKSSKSSTKKSLSKKS